MKPRSIFKEHLLGDKYDGKDRIDDKLFLLRVKPAFPSSWLGHGTRIRQLIVEFSWAPRGKREREASPTTEPSYFCSFLPPLHKSLGAVPVPPFLTHERTNNAWRRIIFVALTPIVHVLFMQQSL